MPDVEDVGQEAPEETQESQANEEGQGQIDENELAELKQIRDEIAELVEAQKQRLHPSGIADLLDDLPVTSQFRWLQNNPEFLTEGGEE